MALADCTLLTFPRIHDPRGNLTFVQDRDQVPFDIHRAYWLYDVPSGSERGGHAHRHLYQCLVALAGSFTVKLTDGVNTKTVTLNRPYQGLLITPGIWRTIHDFAAGSVCMVLASAPYDEADYIRDFDSFMTEISNS